LWSGIVDDAKAAAVVAHLMGPKLYSGWGVRTLAAGESRYDPIGYHVGTVWPFDNSFIAWGLRRYGYKDEAARIAAGILNAADVPDRDLPSTRPDGADQSRPASADSRWRAGRVVTGQSPGRDVQQPP
jgi:glycogen debranching enzyme